MILELFRFLKILHYGDLIFPRFYRGKKKVAYVLIQIISFVPNFSQYSLFVATGKSNEHLNFTILFLPFWGMKNSLKTIRRQEKIEGVWLAQGLLYFFGERVFYIRILISTY